VNIIEITPSLKEKYNDKLREFEGMFKYPFGKDSFTIDHGKNYFSFFDRLGQTHAFISEENGDITAVGVIVLRTIELTGRYHKEKVWYVCDLKIHPEHRGKFFLQRFIDLALKKYSYLSSHIYGISMNEENGSNRLIQFSSRLKGLNLELSESLNFYLLNCNQVNMTKQTLIEHYNNVKFIDLSGQKDLILSSNNIPLPFLHFSSRLYSELAVKNINPAYQYMFCFPSCHNINKALCKLGLKPMATASILSNIKNSNWNFIETADI